MSVEQPPEVETFRHTIGSSPGWQKQRKQIATESQRVESVGSKSQGGKRARRTVSKINIKGVKTGVNSRLFSALRMSAGWVEERCVANGL